MTRHIKIQINNIVTRLRNQEANNLITKQAIQFLKRIGVEEEGISTVETAFILIAFVVVTSVFVFNILTASIS